MVKKYVHFRRVKEIQENVQRMKMETNVNERVLLSLKEMEERMVKVSQNSNSPYRKRRCSQTLSIFSCKFVLTLLLLKQQKELWGQKKEQFIKASRHFGTALLCVSVNNINEPKTHALFSKMVINQKRQFVFSFLFLPV